MWPCFWSVVLAANVAVESGDFSWTTLIWHLALLFIGSVAMRGAGCTYNDLADHKIDMAVARTRSRPLPSGRITRQQAKIFIVLQALAGLVVLLQFNGFAVAIGIFSLVFVAIYPFAKRFTNWPQFFLGLAFSWGALIGWAGQFGSLAWPAVLLYVSSIAWTIGYDTIYAHQDKKDDAAVGIGSTALLFGKNTNHWLAFLYGTALIMICLSFWMSGVNVIVYSGLAAAAIMLFRQVWVLNIDDVAQCLALFKSNNHVGVLIFAGLILPLLLM